MVTSKGILFFEPSENISKEPVIDSLTKKMVASIRNGKKTDWVSCGVHKCACGACSSATNIVLPNGEETNSLAIHYLAYHREEIPQEQIEKITLLNDGEEDPTKEELSGLK